MEKVEHNARPAIGQQVLVMRAVKMRKAWDYNRTSIQYSSRPIKPFVGYYIGYRKVQDTHFDRREEKTAYTDTYTGETEHTTASWKRASEVTKVQEVWLIAPSETRNAIRAFPTDCTVIASAVVPS